MSLKRGFFYTLITSLAIAALCGIAALVFDVNNEIAWRVFATMFLITVVSAMVVITLHVIEKGVWLGAMYFNLAMIALAFALWMPAIWLDRAWFRLLERLVGNEEPIWKGYLLVNSFAALSLAGYVATAQLADGWRWIRLATIIAIFSFTVMFDSMAMAEVNEDFFWRWLGVLGILAGLGFFITPILARIQKLETDESTVSTEHDLHLTCPRCQLTQVVHTGHSRCARCRLKFHIEIEEPRCPKCNYLLHMLESPVCPECGHVLGDQEISAPSV